MLTIPTSIVPGSFRQKLKAVFDIGFEAIDLRLSDVAQFDGSPKELGELVKEVGLKIASLGPLAVGTTAKQLANRVDLARELSAELIILDVENSVQLNMEFGKFSDVRIALRPKRELETEVVAHVKNEGLQNLGIALNSFEVLGDGSRPARLREVDGKSVFHVALWDGPVQPMLPGQGTLNLGGLARVMARTGFDGPWSVGASPLGSKTVLNAYRSLVTTLSDAAQTEPKLRQLTPNIPQKVPAKGIEFIEFALCSETAATLESTLAAMSFRRERKHLSKNVTLWRQGAVNIVINIENSGHAGRAFQEHGPCVCDMGLRVQNAAETVARARALGTEDFSQSVGLGELDIPAIRGVGGSIIHFIDEESDLHRVWDIEFEPVTRTSATPPAGIRRIDHVAQTMPYKDMQNWLLFYLTTFEMSKSPIVNVADPSGIVQSQALESPEGEVRLNLNGAADANTLAGTFLSGRTGAGVQHIAFQTDDIFETSELLSASGFPRLSIPQNYYGEIQSEFSLEDEIVAKLKAENILYDQDETGCYFQLYGQSIFDGFFFEIVQRKDGYAGFGAPNAPIRLAAQAQDIQRKGAT